MESRQRPKNKPQLRVEVPSTFKNDEATRSAPRSSPRTAISPTYLPGDRRRTTAIAALLATAAFVNYLIFLPIHRTTRSVSEPYIRGDASLWKDTFLKHGEKECTIWIAPSSLKGVDGYGIFTTRDLQAGESILGGPDGLAITLENLSHQAPAHNQWRRVWSEYYWARGLPDHSLAEAPPDVADFQVGFGSLPNHHCVLSYLDMHYPEPPYDDTLANRYKDPSAGAFSYNRGREFTVSHFQAAGSEIFLNYGYCRHGEHEPSWTDHIYVTSDFDMAAQLIINYRNPSRGISFDKEGHAMVPAGTSQLVQNLLPLNKEGFIELMAGVRMREELLERIALKSLNQRTPEWIKANGLCLENLLAKRSTIKGAGQGGFAQRTIRKGEIVAPAPLMQVVDKEALSLYDREGNRVGTQLLMNYCFGHNSTTMLLCPNTNAVLLNHCSLRTKECGETGPNAEYQWSSGWDPTSDEWRRKSIDEIAMEPRRGLAFEIVAIRDIAPGEEVFIDYGPEWEEAWARHAASWFPPPQPMGPWVSAKEANENGGKILDQFVSGDPRLTVEHEYLFTACQYWPSSADENSVYTASPFDWEQMNDDDLLARFAGSGSSYGYSGSRTYSRHRDGSHWPCTVIRPDGKDSYLVRIHQDPWKDTMPWHKTGVPRFLGWYPRSAIRYFVKPFHSDQHLPGVFRQPMGIREEVMPTHWRNLEY